MILTTVSNSNGVVDLCSYCSYAIGQYLHCNKVNEFNKYVSYKSGLRHKRTTVGINDIMLSTQSAQSPDQSETIQMT